MNSYLFYRILNIVNKLLISSIFTLTYLSITIDGTPKFYTVVNFVFSYVVAEVLYQIAKRIYKPMFVDKDTMNLADVIDTQIGPKQHDAILDDGTYRERYRFELNLVVLVFSIIAYLGFHASIGILTEYLHIALPIKQSGALFARGLLLFFQYTMALLCVMILMQHVEYDLKNHKKLFHDGFELVIGLLFLIFLCIFLKELLIGS